MALYAPGTVLASGDVKRLRAGSLLSRASQQSGNMQEKDGSIMQRYNGSDCVGYQKNTNEEP